MRLKRFIRRFVINIIVLLTGLLVMYLLIPEVFGHVYSILGKLLGPGLVTLMIVVSALPRRR